MAYITNLRHNLLNALNGNGRGISRLDVGRTSLVPKPEKKKDHETISRTKEAEPEDRITQDKKTSSKSQRAKKRQAEYQIESLAT